MISAASFGLNSVNVRRGVLTGTAAQAIYVTVILGTPIFLVAALATGQIFHAGDLTFKSYFLLVWAGILHFCVGRYLNYRSIQAMGANRSAPLQALAVIISVVMAIFLLDEKLTIGIVVGVILVVIGPIIMLERAKNPGAKEPLRNGSKRGTGQGPVQGWAGVPATRPQSSAPTFVVRQAEGYTFGLMAAVVWGVTPIMIRAALLQSNLSVFGGFVSYLAAALVLIASFGLPGRLASILSMDKVARRWFMQSALSGSSAQIFWYLSLGLIPVTIAAPLQRTTALFTLFFSYLVNRKVESFEPRVIIGIVLSVVGGIALAF